MPPSPGYMPTFPQFGNSGSHIASNLNRQSIPQFGRGNFFPSWQSTETFGFIYKPQFQPDPFHSNMFVDKNFPIDFGWMTSLPNNNLAVPSYGFYQRTEITPATFPVPPLDEGQKVYFADTSLIIPTAPSTFACTDSMGCVVWDQGVPTVLPPMAGVPLLRPGSGTNTATGNPGFTGMVAPQPAPSDSKFLFSCIFHTMAAKPS